MSIYLWSDLHLNHERIINYEQRPFANVTQMNQALLSAWSETVKSQDTIINLGDVAFSTSHAELQKIITNLPGHKILILGNHDRDKSVKWWQEVGFDEVYPYPIIYEGFYILSHESLYVGKEMPYVNLHGHTHGESTDNPQKFNVSVEVIGYRPILFDEIKAKFVKD